MESMTLPVDGSFREPKRPAAHCHPAGVGQLVNQGGAGVSEHTGHLRRGNS